MGQNMKLNVGNTERAGSNIIISFLKKVLRNKYHVFLTFLVLNLIKVSFI